MTRGGMRVAVLAVQLVLCVAASDDAAVLHYVDLMYNRTECVRTSLAQMHPTGRFERFLERFSAHTGGAVRTANVLTHLFLQQRGADIAEEFYYALVRLAVETDPMVFASSLAFARGVAREGRFRPTATRGAEGHVTTHDAASTPYDDPSWVGNAWFTVPAARNASATAVVPPPGLVVPPTAGFWAVPYYDCGGSNTWLVTFSLPFYGPGSSSDHLAFRGVATVSFDLRWVDIDQCSVDEEMLFSNTHSCNLTSTECVPVPGHGFRSGGYVCRCRPGFYATEPSYVPSQDTYVCRPPSGPCEADACYVQYDMVLRSGVLGVQSLVCTVAVILALVVFSIRKTKVIMGAMWLMLEMVILGGFILHQTVIVRYFEPTIATCLLEPWLRGIGFTVFYGAIILKIYRILAEFQTRKALRVCVRERDLLKYLTGAVVVVSAYLAAWTAVELDQGQLLDVGRTLDGLRYSVCRELAWDYVTETGELLFIILGIYLSYCIRNANLEYYREKLALCWTLYIEMFISFIVYSIRHLVWMSWHPDYIFLLYFARCHLTVTFSLLLIFVPKVWYYYRPLDGHHDSHDHPPDRRPEALKLHEAIMTTGELSEVNLGDMDPEDIRAELRRVYTQLQVLRNKTMRKDNPHISKRRGGRKGTHRRFSLQAFHKYRGEVSRTPEESTVSMEGSTVLPELGAGPSPAI